MLADLLHAHEGARPLPDERLTVSRWVNDWLPHQRVRPGTLGNYRHYADLINAELGRVPIRRLSVTQVETTLAALEARGYAANSAAMFRQVLGLALDAAVRDGHLTTNPARLARGPKGQRRGKAAPSTAEVRAVLAALEAHRLHALYVVLAATGLRIGEALGLEWADIDGATLTVRFQLAYQGGEKVHADTKSRGSVGRYALPPVAVRALERHRARQNEERLAAGPRWVDRGLVFTQRRPPGEAMAESSAQVVLRRACAAAGVRHMSPHDLRRWAATNITDRVGRDVAQRLLGHTSGDTTELYVTLTDDARRRAAAAIEEALG